MNIFIILNHHLYLIRDVFLVMTCLWNRRIAFLTLFAFNLICLNGQNLVPNGSFEDYVDFIHANPAGWHKVQNSDTPDYFNLGKDHPFNNYFSDYSGGTLAKEGDGFAGIFCYRISPSRNAKNVREYIETRLDHSLQKDSMYQLEISLCLDNESNVSIKNFGVLFTPENLEFKNDYRLFNSKPQIEFSLLYPDSMRKWATFHAFYKANGTERFIILGNFRNDKQSKIYTIKPVKVKRKYRKWNLDPFETAAYYYLDGVKLEKIVQEKPVTEVIPQPSRETVDTLNLNTIEIDSAVVLKNVYFDFDKYDLLPASFVEIDRLYRLMADNPAIRIKLEGHTDNIGSYDFNLQLSLKRAEAVARYLINKGIDPNRIEFAGYSFSFPLAPNDTDDGRKINRRVVFKVVEK